MMHNRLNKQEVKFGKTGQDDSETRMFKNYQIVHMYTIQGQEQITPGTKF